MNSQFIKIHKIDEVPEWFVGFTFSNGIITAYQELYLNFEDLPKFAAELLKYPIGIEEINFEIGSENPKDRSAYYLKIFIYKYKISGQTAIRVELNNNCDGQNMAKATLNILCDPVQVNLLGEKIISWIKYPDEEFNFTF